MICLRLVFLFFVLECVRVRNEESFCSCRILERPAGKGGPGEMAALEEEERGGRREKRGVEVFLPSFIFSFFFFPPFERKSTISLSSHLPSLSLPLSPFSSPTAKLEGPLSSSLSREEAEGGSQSLRKRRKKRQKKNRASFLRWLAATTAARAFREMKTLARRRRKNSRRRGSRSAWRRTKSSSRQKSWRKCPASCERRPPRRKRRPTRRRRKQLLRLWTRSERRKTPKWTMVLTSPCDLPQVALVEARAALEVARARRRRRARARRRRKGRGGDGGATPAVEARSRRRQAQRCLWLWPCSRCSPLLQGRRGGPLARGRRRRRRRRWQGQGGGEGGAPRAQWLHERLVHQALGELASRVLLQDGALPRGLLRHPGSRVLRPPPPPHPPCLSTLFLSSFFDHKSLSTCLVALFYNL